MSAWREKYKGWDCWQYWHALSTEPFTGCRNNMFTVINNCAVTIGTCFNRKKLTKIKKNKTDKREKVSRSKWLFANLWTDMRLVIVWLQILFKTKCEKARATCLTERRGWRTPVPNGDGDDWLLEWVNSYRGEGRSRVEWSGGRAHQ